MSATRDDLDLPDRRDLDAPLSRSFATLGTAGNFRPTEPVTDRPNSPEMIQKSNSTDTIESVLSRTSSQNSWDTADEEQSLAWNEFQKLPPDDKKKVIEKPIRAPSVLVLEIEGPQLNFTTRLPSDLLVSEAQARLRVKCGGSTADHFCIWHRGRRLKPSKTLAQAGVRDEINRIYFGAFPPVQPGESEKFHSKIMYQRRMIVQTLEEHAGAMTNERGDISSHKSTHTPRVNLSLHDPDGDLADLVWSYCARLPRVDVTCVHLFQSAKKRDPAGVDAFVLFGNVFGTPEEGHKMWEFVNEHIPGANHAIRSKILDKYAGEAPLFSSMVVRGGDSQADNDFVVVYVCAYLGQSNMALQRHTTGLYSAFWACLQGISRHNQKTGNSIQSVRFDVDWNLGVTSTSAQLVVTDSDRANEETARHLFVALVCWIFPPSSTDVDYPTHKDAVLSMPLSLTEEDRRQQMYSLMEVDAIRLRGFLSQRQASFLLDIINCAISEDLIAVSDRSVSPHPSRRRTTSLMKRPSRASLRTSSARRMSMAELHANDPMVQITDAIVAKSYVRTKAQAKDVFASTLRTICELAWPDERAKGLRSEILKRPAMFGFLLAFVSDGWTSPTMRLASDVGVIVYQKLDLSQLGPVSAATSLAQGAASSVLKVTPPGFKEEMAVKQAVFEPIGMADADDYAAREAWREIVLLAMLDHPNIIKIHSAYVPDLQKEEAAITGVPLEDRPKDVWPLARCHILMPLMETNLRRCIAEEPAMLSDDTRLTLATELASALEYLHSHDVIHRDIKSLNVLLQKTVTKTGGKNGSMRKRTRWTVKLADFGSARALPAAMTDNPFRSDLTGGIGTCAWMAPELFGSKQYDCSADTYSFGIVLWELFTGKVPFDKATNFQIPNLVMQGTRPDLPEEGKEPHFSGPRADTIRSLITQCWHKHSQKRPEMYTVVQTLESIPLSRGGATREELTLEIFQKPGTPKGGGRRGSEQRPQPLDMSELTPSTESGTNGTPRSGANGTPRKSEGKSRRDSKDMSKELKEAAAETKDKRDSGKKDRKRNSEKQKREAKESESTSSSPSGSVLLNGKTPSEALNPKTTLEDGRGELSDSGGSVVSTKSDPPQKPKPKEEKKSKRKSARRSEREDSSGRESVDRDEKKREKKKGKDRKSKN